MKKYLGLLSLWYLIPTTALAQGTIISLAQGIIVFINNYVIPLLIGIGVVFFITNTIRYFILDSDNEEGRTRAKTLMFYSIIGLTVIVIFWALVAFTIRGFGFDRVLNPNCRPVPDYINPLGYICDGGNTTNPHAGIGEGLLQFGNGNTAPSTPNQQEPVPDNDELGGAPLTPGSGGDADTDPDPGSFIPSDNEAQDNTLTPGTGIEDDEIDEEALQAAQETLAETQEALEFLSSLYTDSLRETDNSLFGTFGTAVADSGLLDPSAASNDDQRLQAAYRLQQLGRISQANYTEYYDAINDYRIQMAMTPLPPEWREQHPNIAVTNPPSSITAAQTSTQNEIRNRLDSVEFVSTESEMNILFDSSIDQSERLNYASNNLGVVFQDGEVFDQYMDYLQTERFLSGQNIGEQV